MPYTKTGPFVPGGLPAADAAWFNKTEQGIADAFAALGDIRVRAHNNAPQGVAGSGANPSIMSFNTNDYDTDGMHPQPAGGTRFTAVHAGMYVIMGVILPQQQPPGNYQMLLRANGNSPIVYQSNGIVSQIWEGSVVGLRYLAAGIATGHHERVERQKAEDAERLAQARSSAE
jgi:hypothetical protein